MSFIHFFLIRLFIFSPLMARGHITIEEFNWKTYSGRPPLKMIADHQLPLQFQSSSIQCILKCIGQIACAAACIHSKSRCRLYTGGNKSVGRFTEQTAICFVNVLHGSDKYLYRKISKKNSPIDQPAGSREVIVSSVTQAAVSGTKTQMSWEQKQKKQICPPPLEDHPTLDTCNEDQKDSSQLQLDGNISRLHQACEEGQLDVVTYVISNQLADINSRGRDGKTPVMVAARNRRVGMFNYLMSKDCDLFARDKDNNTLLHMACVGGSIEIVKIVLSRKSLGIDSKGHLGRTPVMSVARHGRYRQLQMLKFLMHKNCSLDAIDDNNDTIFHLACKCGVLSSVKYLLSLKKVDIEKRGKKGSTPVMGAVKHGHLEVVKFLKTKLCNLNTVDIEFNSILHHACRSGRKNMVNYIMSLNVVSIESRGYKGMTPVMIAARYGRLNVVKLLNAKNCNLSAVDDDFNNIIHIACHDHMNKSHMNIVKYLLSLDKVFIESRGHMGWTPVMNSVFHGQLHLMKYFIEKGCNLTTVDDNNNTILHLATYKGCIALVKFIRSLNTVSIDSRGVNGRTPVMTAAESGHLQVVVLLIKKNCNLSAIDDSHNNILHAACESGQIDLVRYILSLNTVGIESRGYNGSTPVMTTIKHGHIKLFNFFISQGCNLSARDFAGNTVLHYACTGGNLDVFKCIISLNISGVDAKGYCRKSSCNLCRAREVENLNDLE